MEEDDALNAQTFGGEGDGGEYPDFFGGEAVAASNEEEDEELNGLTFGDGFDIPLTGLPEFFSAVGEPGGNTAEQDDLAAITGAPTSDWKASAAKFADIQAEYLRDLHLKRTAAAQSAVDQLTRESALSSLLSLGLEEEEEERPAPAAAAPMAAGAVGAVPGDGGRGVKVVKQSTVAAASPLAGKSVIAAEELEAQMMLTATATGAAAPAAATVPVPSRSAARAITEAGLVPVLYDTTMQRVPFPAGWNDGDVPPAGHFIAYEAAPAPIEPLPASSVTEVASQQPPPVAPPEPMQAQAQSQVPVPQLLAAQAQVPPQAIAQHMVPLQPPPPQQQQAGGPLPPLPPAAVANLQAKMQRWMVLAAQTPGGMAALPPDVKAQAFETQTLLQMHFTALAQHQQRMMMQQQQQRAAMMGAMPMPNLPGAPGGYAQPPPAPFLASYMQQQQHQMMAQAQARPQGPPLPQQLQQPGVAVPAHTLGAVSPPPLPQGAPPMPPPQQQQPPLPGSQLPLPLQGQGGGQVPRGWAKVPAGSSGSATTAAGGVEVSSGEGGVRVVRVSTPTKQRAEGQSGGGGGGGGDIGPTPAESAALPSGQKSLRGPRASAQGNQSSRIAAGPSAPGAAGFFEQPQSSQPPLPRTSPPPYGHAQPPLPRGPPPSMHAGGGFSTSQHRFGARRPVTTTLRTDAYAQFLRSAALAAAAYKKGASASGFSAGSMGGVAAAGGVSMASILSRPLPMNAGGKWMPHREVELVARFMYNSISNAADPFVECYYLFALRAKAAADAARAMSAAAAALQHQQGQEAAAADSAGASAPPANVLDAAAILTSLGTSAIAKRATESGSQPPAGAPTSPSPADADGGAGSSGAATRGKPASGAGEENAGSEVARIIASIPLATVYSKNVAANLADLKRIAANKRRIWETHHQVLGRQQSTSIRAPRTVLNLSATGVTPAQDLRPASNKHKDKEKEKEKSEGDEEARGSLDGEAPAAADASSAGAGASSSEPSVVSAQESAINTDLAWIARARIDAALQCVLQLQEAARTLQAHLRKTPPPPKDVMMELRTEVLRLREELAATLGLRRTAAHPAGSDGSGEEQAPVASAATPSIDDDVVLLLASLPKGKRLLCRAVPMLLPADRVTAVSAGLRHLPHFVASAMEGKEAEDADAALAAMLAQLVKSVVAPAPTAVPPPTPPAAGDADDAAAAAAVAAAAVAAAAAQAGMKASLDMLHAWLQELHTHQAGAIRALLEFAAAQQVISNLLFRGVHEAEAAAGVDALAQSVAQWNAATEALGKAYVEET